MPPEPTEEMYYVHRKGTFTGNAPAWWAKDGKGYTSYILGAERFTKEEAEKLFNGDPNKWAIYKCSEVDARLHLVYDIQDDKNLGTDNPSGWLSPYAKNSFTHNIEHEEIAKQIPEALRQAIIKDFVEGLKPKAFLYRELSGNGFKETVSTNDVLDKFEVVNGKKVIPLYSLEEWK